MEVISESLQIENKDVLPQILMRIFAVCKADPSFPLKAKMQLVEGEALTLESRIEHQKVLIKNTTDLRDDLSKRLQMLRQENFEKRSRLLEELGSEE